MARPEKLMSDKLLSNFGYDPRLMAAANPEVIEKMKTSIVNQWKREFAAAVSFVEGRDSGLGRMSDKTQLDD